MSTLTAPTPRLLAPRRALGPTRPRAARSVAVRVRWDRIAAVLALVVVLVWLLGAGLAGRSEAETTPSAPIQVVVQPGDTLWDMARQHAPADMATLEYVMLVEQHNDVRAGALLPGTLLELPQR